MTVIKDLQDCVQFYLIKVMGGIRFLVLIRLNYRMEVKFSKVWWLLLCICGNFLPGSQQISSPTDPTYNAGIVEFIPAAVGQGKVLVKDNLKRMLAIIESDATKDLDILVFPENVLNNLNMTTYVPDPKERVIPCEIPNYDWFLTQLSCAARSRHLYVVVNLCEKVKCSSAENCSRRYYNTNVVFDREGRVISRYRKTHLYRYEWYSYNILEKPDLATFRTDFGVTFGHFICFDMMFYAPAQILVREMNITDIIYPTFWFSELPFLTAVQLQEGWAFANNVNLLAADGSDPAGQNTGSGIYAGRLGRLVAVIHEEATTKLLTAKVPKRSSPLPYQMPTAVRPLFQPQLETPRFTKMSLLRDYNVDIFKTKLLAESFLDARETLCHGEFCCSFDVRRRKIAESPLHHSYRYRLAAYSGNYTTFQRIDSSNQSLCALFACTGEELYTCGHIFPADVQVGNKFYFDKINISGSFAHAERRLIMPSTVNAMMMPLSVDDFEWMEQERNFSTRIQMILTSPQQNLLTFGIWANYYSRTPNKHNLDTLQDNIKPSPSPSTSSSSLSAKASRSVAVFVAVLTTFLLKF